MSEQSQRRFSVSPPAEFDEDLKGKHFLVPASGLVFEATGYWKPRSHPKCRMIRLIRMYTIYGKPNPDYLADYSLQETDEPLSELPNKPKKGENA